LAAVLAVVVLLAALVIASVAIKSVALWFIAGALVSLFLLQALADGLRWLARRAPRPRQPLLRLALGNLHRPGAPTGSTVLALGLGLSLVVAVGQVESNITRQIESRMGGAAPAFYFIDIQPDQIADLEAAVAGADPDAELQRVPHLRGRITAIKGVPVEAVTIDPSAAWAVNSDRGITYAAAVPAGSSVVAGEWWPEDYAGPPLISLGDHIAQGLGVTVGDSLTINVLGRDIEGRIANLRSIDWSTLGINFVIVFAPGALEAAPQSHIATVHVAPEDEAAVFKAVTERLPNVSGVAVRNVLESIKRLLGDIAAGARAAGLVTLVASALVVGGAVAAGQRRRMHDAVVLKVLGATRGHLMGAFVAEFSVLGVISGLAAAALGSLGAWLIITRLMRIDWVFAPGAAAGGVALCLVVSLGLGFAGTWRALGQPVAPVLRHD
jgi:putative ABC transport system permease protein